MFLCEMDLNDSRISEQSSVTWRWECSMGVWIPDLVLRGFVILLNFSGHENSNNNTWYLRYLGTYIHEFT